MDTVKNGSSQQTSLVDDSESSSVGTTSHYSKRNTAKKELNQKTNGTAKPIGDSSEKSSYELAGLIKVNSIQQLLLISHYTLRFKFSISLNLPWRIM